MATGAHLERAMLLLGQGRLDAAEGELRLAIAEAPSDPHAHALLGMCLADLKRYDEAEHESRLAVANGPDRAFSFHSLARVLRERRRTDEAVAAIGEAIRLDPEEPADFALLAELRLEQARWAEALAAAEMGLELDPEHRACTNLRAIALVKLGRPVDAGEAVGAALARDPNDALSHANQGWTLLERGQPERALEHFREALRLEPNFEWARHGIVTALKARNPLYGLLLRYFLWMSRLGNGSQWGVIVGGLLGYQVLLRVVEVHPSLAPWSGPITWCYLGFVYLSWSADPIFELLLRLDRFGRLALSRKEIARSNWVGACLLAAFACLVPWAFGWGGAARGPDWLRSAAGAAILVIPVSAAFRCAPGWPRAAMALVTIGLATLWLGFLALCALEPATLAEGARHAWRGLAAVVWSVFLLGAVLSSWLANGLMMARPTR